RTQPQLYRYEQLPSAGPPPVVEGKGAALPDAVAAGGLGLYLRRPGPDQPREDRRDPRRGAGAGSCRLRRPIPRTGCKGASAWCRLCDLRTAPNTVTCAGFTYVGKSNVGESYVGFPYIGKSNAIK